MWSILPAMHSIDLDGNVTVNNTGDGDLAPVRTDISAKQQTADSDYLAQAQKGLAAYNQKKTEAIEKENSKSGFWKFLENMALAGLTANDNPFVMSMNQQAQIYRQDTSYKEPNDKWSQEQKDQFGYLYMMDPAYASQYAEAINNEINKAAADAQRTQIVADAGDSKLKSTATAILKGFTGTADFLDNIAEFSGRGTITQKADLSFFEQSQAEIQGVSESLNELGTISENVPVIGGKGLGDLYGLGISAAQSLIYGATGNGALTMIQYFGQAAASGVDEKMEQGATAKQAMLFGLASGTAEAVAEKIGIDNLFKNGGAKTFRGFLGNMLKQGAAEGMEEAITSVLNTFSDEVIMGKESQYKKAVAEYSKTMSLEEAKKKALGDIMEGIAYDALGGMITGSGNTAVMTSGRATVNVSQGKGALSGLTANEQKVVDKVYKDLVAEEAEKSKDGKVSGKRKTELFEEAIKAMDEGSISIETIEEVLGGDSYKAYRDAVDNETALQKEYDGLNAMRLGELTGVQTDRKAELRRQLDEIKSGNQQALLKEKLEKNVAELAKVSRLSESYREKERRYQAFQADVSQYSGRSQQIVQKAVDSGILNNTRRSHQLVDLIAKVGGDKDMDFDFTNNEKLKESGFALDGKTVNGVLTKDGVTINIKSAKALNSVVGHEITHVLEGSEFYSALAETATALAKAKGEYDSRLKDIEALYSEELEGYGGEGRTAALEKELVADLVGDYLFTDTEFINRLSTGDRNTFEKIFDEIKYLCRVATAGSKEAKQLEKVKKAFEDAYRQDAKNTAEDGGVRYSIETLPDGKKYVRADRQVIFGNNPDSWSEQVEDYINGKIRKGENVSLVAEDGEILTLTKDTAGKIASNKTNHGTTMDDEKFYVKANAGVHIDELAQASVNADHSKSPKSDKDSRHGAFAERGWTYRNAFFQDFDKKYYRLTISVAKGADGNVVYNIGNIEERRFPTVVGSSAKGGALNGESSSTTIISTDREKVNQKFSLSSQEDMFPVRKDLDAVRGKIYGSDVQLRELGPVRKDLQAEETAQDTYEDLPFDMPDNLAEGQLTDEELEADAKHQPVETVAQRLKVKFASLRQELQTNEQGRKESWDAYDRRIEELQQRYDAKPKKYTKAANAVLRQIAKQKQLQTQRDAEFEKRINDIKKKIDQTRELMQWDHSREDLLEQQLRRVDEQLEADKQALDEEFRERRAQAEKLADKGSYISREARILYDEIKNHQKGTRFSDDIGELLDAGHSFPQIKSALLMIEKYPDHVKGRSWIVEQDARAILERNYENAVYGIDKIDDEYQSKLEALEKKAKEDRESYTVAAQRKNKQQQYEQLMEDLVGDTSTWQDKKLGLQYQVNTLRRNLRDVVRDEKGNRDIAKADAIWEELQGKYNQHEAELKRESARIKQAYADMKITKEEDVYIQMLGEFRHNPETELSLETVEGYYQEHKDKIDTEKVDKAIELARKTYDELLVRVNAALREQGMKEIPYRQGYFPHFTEEAKGRFRMFLEKVLNFKYKSDDIPTDIAGLTEGFTPNRSYQHFNKQRVSDLTEYNFSKGMDSYVHGALDWIYHIEDIQKRRALENHLRYIHSEEGTQARINEAKANEMWDADQVQEEIDKILKEAKNPLNNLVTDLRTGTNILAGKKNTMDRGMENATNRAVYSVMTSLSSRVNANMVAGSISSALTNFIPITQSWGEVSPVSSAVAARDTILSYVYDDGVVDKSDFLTNRLRAEENLYKTGWDKVSDKVGWLMEAVDNFTSQTVWRSKYRENLTNGMSEAEAIKNADEFAEGVMAGRSRGNMPTLFDAKNPVARVLTAFQLEVNNQYGYMLKDMPVNMRNEAKGKLVAGYAKMFVGAYVFNALYSQLTGRNAAFDPVRIIQELLGDLFPDEDEEEKKASEIVGNFAENVIDELPFVSGLFGGGRIPISSALPYGEGPLEMITGTIKDIENKDVANLTWEWLNPAFYLIAPVGGGQMRKTAQGVSMFLGDKPVSGSYTSSGNLRFPVAETPLNIAQAAIFGQWANENARKYIDEGRSPIAESQIQDYLDSGLTYEAWWERKDELKKVDNDFETNEPITSFRQILEQVEDVAAEADAGKEDLLKEKFLRSAADELSGIKSEMKELVTMPLAEVYKERNMQTLQDKANEIAKSAMDAYSNVVFDGDYAKVGEKVWKHDEDGQWRRLTGDALTKYQVTSDAGDADYATDGTVQYYRTNDGWKKLSEEQIAKQDAVTAALDITPEEYWGDRQEEYNYAYENPELYLLTQAVGGYEAYTGHKEKINKIEGDKKNGKTISGSKKKKVWQYIQQQKMADGQKYLLFKSLYPADDTYNREIIQYMNSMKDLTAAEKKKILEKLDFKVNRDGTITW